MTDFLFGSMVQANTPINISSAVVAANVSVTGSGLPTIGLFSPGTNQLGFATNSVQQMVINSSGQVGIGTAAPGVTFDLIGNTGAVAAPTYLNQTSFAFRNNFHTRMAMVNPGSPYVSQLSSYTAGAAFPTTTLTFGTSSTFLFENGDGTVATTEKMRITSTGNVGINTTSVTAGTMLAVAGGNISLYGSTSGVINLAAPAAAGTNTITFPAASGTVQLTGQGGITALTAVATTSGTAILFTGIPSTVRRITVNFQNVSINNTGVMQIQIGSGSVQNTGYTSQAYQLNNAASTGVVTTGFGLGVSQAASSGLHGSIIISYLSATIWTAVWQFYFTGGANFTGAGTVTVSGAPDRVNLTTVAGTATFNQGTLNVLYE
jgi:hypothetical protein